MAQRYRVSINPAEDPDQSELRVEHLDDVMVPGTTDETIYVECATCGVMPSDQDEFTCLKPEEPCPLLTLNSVSEEDFDS